MPIEPYKKGERLIKKHINAFTANERALVQKKLQDIKSTEKCQHCIDRMQEKNISSEEMMRVFQSYEIIEYHQRNDSHRILIRGKKKEKGRNICLVVELDTGNIITTYANHSMDNHKTLRYEEYDNSIDLIKILM